MADFQGQLYMLEKEIEFKSMLLTMYNITCPSIGKIKLEVDEN